MLARLTSALAAVALDRDIARDVAAALARGALGKTKQMVRTVSQSLDLQAAKVVSHKYRCLWLCNPKAASRSIKTTLLDADPAAEVHKASVSDLYARLPEVRSYYSFAFVRHPFTRALSFHSELHFSPRISTGEPPPLSKEAKRRVILALCYGLADTNDFDAYCRWLNTPWGSDAFADRHFLSQHVQIRLDDRRQPDFVTTTSNGASNVCIALRFTRAAIDRWTAKISPAATAVIRRSRLIATSTLNCTPTCAAMRRMASWIGLPSVTPHRAFGSPIISAS